MSQLLDQRTHTIAEDLENLEIKLNDVSHAKKVVEAHYQEIQDNMRGLPTQISALLLEVRKEIKQEYKKNLKHFEAECYDKYITQFKQQNFDKIKQLMVKEILTEATKVIEGTVSTEKLLDAKTRLLNE